MRSEKQNFSSYLSHKTRFLRNQPRYIILERMQNLWRKKISEI